MPTILAQRAVRHMAYDNSFMLYEINMQHSPLAFCRQAIYGRYFGPFHTLSAGSLDYSYLIDFDIYGSLIFETPAYNSPLFDRLKLNSRVRLAGVTCVPNSGRMYFKLAVNGYFINSSGAVTKVPTKAWRKRNK